MGSFHFYSASRIVSWITPLVPVLGVSRIHGLPIAFFVASFEGSAVLLVIPASQAGVHLSSLSSIEFSPKDAVTVGSVGFLYRVDVPLTRPTCAASQSHGGYSPGRGQNG